MADADYAGTVACTGRLCKCGLLMTDPLIVVIESAICILTGQTPVR